MLCLQIFLNFVGEELINQRSIRSSKQCLYSHIYSRMSCRSALMDSRSYTNRFLLCSCIVLVSAAVVRSQVQAAAVDDWACNTAKHIVSPCSTSEEQCYTKCLCRADEGWSKAAGPWQGGYCNPSDECICCNAHGNAGDEQLPSGKVITCV